MILSTLPRRLTRPLFIAVIALAMVAASAVAAMAATITPDAGSGSGGPSTCAYTGTGSYLEADTLLPMNRWSGATTSFHSRIGGISSMQFLGRMQRDIGAGFSMSMGDMFWSWTSGLTTTALRFCAIDGFGTKIDQMAAVIGNAMFGSAATTSIVATIVVLALGYAVWNGYRRGGIVPWRQIAASIGVLALFAVMLSGATRTTDSEFGRFSPGWTVSTANRVISDVAAAPARAISFDDLQAPESAAGNDMMSCQRYVHELRNQYEETHGSWNAATNIPVILNGLWEATGMEAWKTAQFGANDHADRVYCRLLDEFADVPVGTWNRDDFVSPTGTQISSIEDRQWRESRIGVMRHYWDGPRPRPNSIAFTAVDDKTRDVSLVAWATCDIDDSGNWAWRAGTDSLRFGNPDIDPDDGAGDTDGGRGCAGWWTQRAVAGSGGFDDGGSAFDTGTDVATIVEETSGQERDFLLTMHSNKAGNSTMVAAGYAFSALIMFVVFGLLSLAIIMAKFMVVVMILAVFFVLAVGVFRVVTGSGAGSGISNLARKLLGYILISAFAVLLISFVTMLTGIMVEIGEVALTRGSPLHMLWVGLSPVAAVIGLSLVFTKVLKVPNPMTPRGAAAWGAAAGTVGGGVAGYMGSRIAGSAQRAAGNALGDAGSAALHKATGGRFGRPSGGSRHHGDDVGGGKMKPLPRKGRAEENVTMKGRRAAQTGDEVVGDRGDSHPPSRRERREMREAEEKALLAEKGLDENASRAERAAVLKDHRKEIDKEAKRRRLAEWEATHGESFRGAMDRRRRAKLVDADGNPLTAATKDGKPVKRAHLSPREMLGAAKDSAKSRAKVAADAFRDAPVRTLGRGAKKVVSTAAKGGGALLAGAALGPALPLAAAALGGGLIARKALRGTTGAYQESNKHAMQIMLERQRSREQADRQAREAAEQSAPGPRQNEWGNDGASGSGSGRRSHVPSGAGRASRDAETAPLDPLTGQQASGSRGPRSRRPAPEAAPTNGRRSWEQPKESSRPESGQRPGDDAPSAPSRRSVSNREDAGRAASSGHTPSAGSQSKEG